ncbi:uncharacterized protein BDZ99DRAFT_524148 [Mytilinidion resinicola]|uniref:Uncharacterized protein n=1 Tax=Mytilinidion resinicola TaxID=574789 RepID=A0A6A6YBL5_9PEZI|nr:uncharacterized protein BDZ99DRAFT_524148 [Mytilinidion resinicola]KAF2805903.1 hypothetical protein BDZ99DRAFT_524148 [Mytilinidion resinicola]
MECPRQNDEASPQETLERYIKMLEGKEEEEEMLPDTERSTNTHSICTADMKQILLWNDHVLGIMRDTPAAFGRPCPEDATEQHKAALSAYRKCDLAVFLFFDLLQRVLDGKAEVTWCAFHPIPSLKVWRNDSGTREYTPFRHVVFRIRIGALDPIYDPTYEQFG